MRKINGKGRKSPLGRLAALWGWASVPLPGVATEGMGGVNLSIDIDYTNDPFYTEIWFLASVALSLLFLLVLLIRAGVRGRGKRVALKGLNQEAVSKGVPDGAGNNQ